MVGLPSVYNYQSYLILNFKVSSIIRNQKKNGLNIALHSLKNNLVIVITFKLYTDNKTKKTINLVTLRISNIKINHSEPFNILRRFIMTTHVKQSSTRSVRAGGLADQLFVSAQ